MKSVAGLFIAVIAVAAIDSHEWLHSELKISPEQHAALAPIEAGFAEKNRRPREQLRAANHELALALGKGGPDSPELAAAIGKVHRHMGQSQNASIDHLFEMRAKLTPEQSETLLRLAQRALDGSP